MVVGTDSGWFTAWRPVRLLVPRRLGPLEPERAARVEEADLDRIARWTDRLLTEETAEACLRG